MNSFTEFATASEAHLRVLVTGGLESPNLSLAIKMMGSEKVKSRVLNYENT